MANSSKLIPIRYTPFILCIIGTIVSFIALDVVALGPDKQALHFLILFGALTIVGIYDLFQKKIAILRNYPVIGHLRFLLEYIRPEIRQYFIEGDNDEAPFSKAQRTLVYSRAKAVPDQIPFGTSLDVMAPGYQWITANKNTLPASLIFQR